MQTFDHDHDARRMHAFDAMAPEDRAAAVLRLVSEHGAEVAAMAADVSLEQIALLGREGAP